MKKFLFCCIFLLSLSSTGFAEGITPPTERHTHEGVDEWFSGRDSTQTSQREVETEKLGTMSVRAWGSTRLVVNVPVADICSEPNISQSVCINDDSRQTQVLYGENLILIGKQNNWYEVEAIEQAEFTQHSNWQGYRGWIAENTVLEVADFLENNLIVKEKTGEIYLLGNLDGPPEYVVSLGTRLSLKSETDKRYEINLLDGRIGWIQKESVNKNPLLTEKMQVINTAKKLLDVPYLWGGRSAFADDHIPAGVDCSGLVNLAYRVNGKDIPRDTHEQFVKSRPIKKEDLADADFIFWSKQGSPEKISHVALYYGDERVLDAPGMEGSGKKVRDISLKEWVEERKNGFIRFGKID